MKIINLANKQDTEDFAMEEFEIEREEHLDQQRTNSERYILFTGCVIILIIIIIFIIVYEIKSVW